VKLIILLNIFLYCLCANEDLFEALPTETKSLSPKAKLGKLLFHDAILSKDNTISCASCHPLLQYGVDNLAKSLGVNQVVGKRNTPTVWNARYNLAQFWDGRAKDLKEQALMPITNPCEMNETLEAVITKLKHSKAYNKHFGELYTDGVNVNNLADALATYGETLITPNSKFDQFLRGDKSALSTKEREGFELFKSKGCVACHNGINVGGTLYQKIGMFEAFDSSEKPDLGRYNVTKNLFDKHVFKVPSLRNIEKTAPYFHDGSVETLKEAVETMAALQLGRELDETDIDKIVLFLKTLTGKVHE